MAIKPPEPESQFDFLPPHSRAKIDYVAAAPHVALRCIEFSPETSRVPFRMLFVPGWISWMDSWRHFLNHLAARLPLHYLETREKPTARVNGTAEFALHDIAGDIVNVAEHYRFPDGEYALVGSSLGATAVIEIANRLPKKPFCIVLMLPNADFQMPRSIVILKALPYRLLMPAKRLVQWIMVKFKINPDDADHRQHFIAALTAADSVRLKESALGLRNYRLDWNTLAAIDIPCLVVGAAADIQHDQDNIMKIYHHLPNAEYRDLRTFTSSHSSRAAQIVYDYICEKYDQSKVAP